MKQFKLPLTNLLWLAKLLCYIFVILTGLAIVAGQILMDNSAAINSFFGAQTQMRIDEEVDPNMSEEEKEALKKKAIYYPTEIETIDELIDKGDRMAEQVVAEGSVLLTNGNGSDGKPALPLQTGASVSLFSASSVYPAISGTGSGGADKTKAGNELFREGFREAGLQVNDELYNWYISNKGYTRQGSGASTARYWTIGDANWSALPAAKTNKVDAAVFILARMGGEGADLDITSGNKSDMTNGDYLALSQTELDVLKNLKAEKAKGTFGRIIVVMNSAYQVCGLDNPEIEVDALLWTGSIGNRGTQAIGNILAGNVNPSGRLSETFWTKHSENPAMVNFGDFTYQSKSSGTTGSKYVVYQEGIYVGYRYTETRYEDAVLEQGNAGSFNYYNTVDYPFGYGLSYTKFDYSGFNAVYDKLNDVYNVTVTVTNSGSKAGKEAVQIYLQKPYTVYDKSNAVEKAAVELVGFGKTKLLGAGDSDTLTIKVKRRDFASYDANNAGTYILDTENNYYLTAARDAHEAVNNILRAKGTAESKLAARGNTGKGDFSLVKAVKVDTRDEKYYSKSANGTEIVNRFDDVDILRFEPDGVNARNFKYTTRSDWEGTLPKSGVALLRTAKMNEMYNLSQGGALKKDVEVVDYPTYGEADAKPSLMLIDLRAYTDGDDDPTNDEWIPYDDPLWDEFLDQLTFEETAALLDNGFRLTVGLERFGKPETLDHNGSCGIKHWGEGKKLGMQMLAPTDHERITSNTATNYPCNSTVASTFDYALLTDYGNQWGEDALWVGYNGLYGPGANINRTAYNGRNFEYYGEDPYISGMSVAAMSEGMSERGLYMYLKHCVLNDQETNRHGINTWANEQTIREVYLKAFQIAIEDGGCEGVMTGFNSLGATWSGAQGFCKTVLHGEFGMTGIAVSDYAQDYMNYPVGVLYGNDLPDGSRVGAFKKYEKNYSELAWAMRESAHHILYTVLHSNAMNGVTANTKFVKLTPPWVTAVGAVQITLYVLLALSAAFLAYEIVANILAKKSEEEQNG